MSNITKIYLLNVPIEKDYKHTLYFSSKEAQQSYFQSKIVQSFTVNNSSYQRKNEPIRAPFHYDNLYKCNYVMYQNTHYSNKWFYAFITDMKYENDGNTSIFIETDVIQTWYFDYSIISAFVEREHVSDDTPGLHTVPEDLETGEFICNSHLIDDNMDNIMEDLQYCLSTSIDYFNISQDDTKYLPATVKNYNGIASGTSYYSFDNNTAISNTLADLEDRGQIETINGLFMAPSSLLPKGQSYQGVNEVASSNSTQTYNNTISKQTTLNGYTPKNKKLLTGAYNYLLVSNNNGNSVIYNYEDFATNTCNFKIDMALTPGCSIRMIPKSYKSMTDGDEYGINMGKLPICSYPVDMYTNWLTQNSINVAGVKVSSDMINIGTTAINGIAGAAMAGGGAGAALGAFNTLANVGNALITKKQHELIPPQSRGNLNSGDVITSSNKNNFHFYKMSIKSEYAHIIDEYFSAFGYKVNRFKVPNSNHRENYWFTKTIDININGDMPQDDIIKIKNIYNSGITFWKNASNIKNYSVSNNII